MYILEFTSQFDRKLKKLVKRNFKLKQKIDELNIPDKDLWWFLETRKFGTAPHSGFGLGFERLILFVTGMSNIRDVIPFPRTPKNADF